MTEDHTLRLLPERLQQHAHDLIHGGTNAGDLLRDLHEAAEALHGIIADANGLIDPEAPPRETVN